MPPALLTTGGSGAGACPVCGGDCTGSPPTDHLSTYPFLPGGRQPVPGKEGVDFVTAPHRIVDHDLERVVYSTGARVPMADAIRYGLVEGPAADPEPAPAKRGRRARPRGEDTAVHGPHEDRARRPDEDREGPAS